MLLEVLKHLEVDKPTPAELEAADRVAANRGIDDVHTEMQKRLQGCVNFGGGDTWISALRQTVSRLSGLSTTRSSNIKFICMSE